MSLKRFFPLLALIVILFIGFGYVKPTIDSISKKTVEKNVKMSEFELVSRTRENYQSLVAELQRLLGQESGRMVMGYLPTSAEQERVADIVNQFALRSGVVVDSVDVGMSKSVRNGALAGTPSLPSAPGNAVAPSAPNLDSLELKVGFRGTYDSAKLFLTGLDSTGRSHDMTSFSIERDDSGEGEVAPSDTLKGTATIRFFFFSEQTYPNAHLLSLFESGTFGTDMIDRLLASSERLSTLPEKSGEGRANPFKF